jgi:hypothetical protein
LNSTAVPDPEVIAGAITVPCQKEKIKVIFETGNPLLYCGYLAIEHTITRH